MQEAVASQKTQRRAGGKASVSHKMATCPLPNSNQPEETEGAAVTAATALESLLSNSLVLQAGDWGLFKPYFM
jgi:hypothetical protein